MSTPQFFRTLADRTRLRIVNLLAHGPLCVCDIQYVLQQPQSSVSRHLAHLRLVSLVRDRRDGMRIFYELTDWGEGVPRGVLETLRRELKREPEYGPDLELLASLKASGECHQEGNDNATPAGPPWVTRRRRVGSKVAAAVPRKTRTGSGSRHAARAQR